MVCIADIETGAGNSFLGGLAAGMLISGDMYQGWHFAIEIFIEFTSLG